MIKKFKLLFSIMAFCLAFSSLMLGVFALNTITYTISGSMEYNVEYALLDITTSVYKYQGPPLTQEEGEKYLTSYSALEPMPEYTQHYATYDENHMAVEGVEDQTVNIDLKYGPGSAYYIVVNVISQTTGMAIGATVTSEFTAENSWSQNTGDVVILKGNRGKNIVFGFGLDKAQKSSNGTFTYSIVFDVIEDYVFTGQVGYDVPNNSTSGGTITSGQESAAGDSYTASIPVTVDISQMDATGTEGSDLTDPANVQSYATFVNVGASEFATDTTITYSLQNVKFYDQNGNQMYSGTSHMYISFQDKTITSTEQAETELLDMFSSIAVDTCKLTTLVGEGEESTATLAIIIQNQYDSTDATKAYVKSVTFDIVIETLAGEPSVNTDLTYDYRYAFMNDGSISVIPGKLTTPTATITQSSTVDIIAPQDYMFDLTMTMEEAMAYLESAGTVVPDNNYALYGNKVIWAQLYAILMFGQEMGVIPVPLKEFTVNVPGMGSHTFKPKNWVQDFYAFLIYADEYFGDDDTARQAFLTENYMPVPTSTTATVTVPVHMYTLENLFMMLLQMAYSGYSNLTSSLTKYEFGLCEDWAKYYIKESLWLGTAAPSIYGLSNTYTDLDIMSFIYNNRTSSMPSSDGNMMAMTVQQYIVVPGTTYTISNMTTFTSDYYTTLSATTASVVAETEQSQTNNVYTLNIFDYTIEVDAKKQQVLCVVPTKEYIFD